MTASVAATARPDTSHHGAAATMALGERVRRAAQRRAGRFRMALLMVVLFLPLMATVLLGAR